MSQALKQSMVLEPWQKRFFAKIRSSLRNLAIPIMEVFPKGSSAFSLEEFNYRGPREMVKHDATAPSRQDLTVLKEGGLSVLKGAAYTALSGPAWSLSKLARKPGAKD